MLDFATSKGHSNSIMLIKHLKIFDLFDNPTLRKVIERFIAEFASNENFGGGSCKKLFSRS